MAMDLPIVDLTSLPIDRQAEEYYLRLERGRTHKDAVEVVFHINRLARICAELALSTPLVIPFGGTLCFYSTNTDL